MYKYFFLLLIVAVTGCINLDPESRKLLKEDYPPLYEAVFERNEEGILSYTRSDDPLVAEQAWKAMINTPTSNLEKLTEKVALANTEESWAALWFKEIEEAEIEVLHAMWDKNPEMRDGIASVLGYHGNKESFNRLMGDDEKNYTRALAIGRLSGALELSDDEHIQVIDLAFDSGSADLTQAYLYGFYRSRKDLATDVEKHMLERWSYYTSVEPGPIQYFVRILIKNHPEETLFQFEMNEFEWMDPRLGIEIAHGLARTKFIKQTPVVFNALLDNRSVHVRIETLRAIKAKEDELKGDMDRTVLNKIGLIRGYNPSLRLNAFLASGLTGRYLDEVRELSEESPYLRNLKYDILSEYLSEAEFFNELKSDLNSEERLIRLYALQELSGWWRNLEDKQLMISEIRPIIYDQMKTADRSMIYGMSSIFMDSLIFTENDYSKIEDMLSRFQLPEDVEVFQAMSSVLKERFEEQSEEFVMSLADEGNGALNSTLKNAGWVIGETESEPVTFRKPDWKRLARLGPNPILMLETNKGDIKIMMDVLSAPATISGMDELIKANDYNGTPFHRVIANFVAQGGDVETQDGFGGPDFVVPTEATTDQYLRGKVGIASAGTDTEGSQYFIMFDWMPHLNGLYTIIGEVHEGMEVVDRIVQGDYVKNAYWY